MASRVRRSRWVALCSVLLGATACTGQVAEPSQDAPATNPAGTSSPSTPSPSKVLAAIPPALRQALPDNSAPVDRAIDIDLSNALAAPTLDDAPINRAMLVAQVSLFRTSSNSGIPSGQPFVMAQNGEWRQVDLERYEFPAPTYGELSIGLSPDGRSLALADPSGLVTINLTTDTYQRFDLPVEHAVALKWSADASTLYLKDRDANRSPCGPKGCALDVTTGNVAAVEFNMFYASPGAAVDVVEVQGWTTSRPARLLTHHLNTEPTATDLAYKATPTTSGGPAAARYVAFTQCFNGPKKKNENGVIVVDPATGAVVAMLTDERPGECRLGAETWLNDRHLLVSDRLSGDLWKWDVRSARFAKIARARTTHLNISVATEALARRLDEWGTTRGS